MCRVRWVHEALGDESGQTKRSSSTAFFFETRLRTQFASPSRPSTPFRTLASIRNGPRARERDVHLVTLAQSGAMEGDPLQPDDHDEPPSPQDHPVDSNKAQSVRHRDPLPPPPLLPPSPFWAPFASHTFWKLWAGGGCGCGSMTRNLRRFHSKTNFPRACCHLSLPLVLGKPT